MDELGLNNMMTSNSIYGELISTVIIIATVFVFHFLVTRYIRKKVRSNELRRKWLVQSCNAFILLLLLGLAFIWGSELRTLALSMVALAVALVVATVDPRVTIQIPSPGEVLLIIRMPAKSKQQGYVEQAILSEVLTGNDFSSKQDK